MVDLSAWEVVVLDGQSTGASPKRGQLVELGWAVTQAEARPSPLEITNRLILLPETEEIAEPIARVTGLSTERVREEGWPEAAVWAELSELARAAPRPAVIHFARFELAFLEGLHRGYGSGRFPFSSVLCTHEIARRLLPDLPRCGLRALTGYFGADAGPLRRAEAHVAATTVVWRHLVERLAEHGIRTPDDLSEWMAQPRPAAPRRRRGYPMPREVRLGLPEGPGVYRMLRSDGEVLYVGKARSLRQRVNGHFRNRGKSTERHLEMLTQAQKLDVTETPTALEAALLESEEIKRLGPPYNLQLAEDRDRRVFFTDPDLVEESPVPTGTCPIGPFGSRFGILELSELSCLLAADESGARAPHPPSLDAVPAPKVGTMPTDPSPSRDLEARTFFDRSERERVEAWLAGLPAAPTLRRRLTRHGRRQSPARLRADDAAERRTRDREAPDPERWVRWLDRLALSLSVAVRRARWLAALSEACLVWREPGRATRLLVISRGRVVERRTVPETLEIPSPPGAQTELRERQSAFDLAAFDRLRVLTTELRALLPELERAEIRFGPRKHLDAHRLARALTWV